MRRISKKYFRKKVNFDPYLVLLVCLGVWAVITLNCIFLFKRLRETRVGNQREQGCGIQATSWRDICTAKCCNKACILKGGGTFFKVVLCCNLDKNECDRILQVVYIPHEKRTEPSGQSALQRNTFPHPLVFLLPFFGFVVDTEQNNRSRSNLRMS